MTILEAWKDSLQLCKPQSMKLIFLVTMNAMRQALRALMALWFLVPVVALLIATVVSGSEILAFIAYGFALGALLLAVRPSVQLKDWRYFKTYFLKLFLFLIELLVWIAVIAAALIAWEFLFVPFGHTHSLYASRNFVFTPINYIATAPAYVGGLLLYAAHMLYLLYYAIFFYLDKVGSVYTSCKKALTLVCYNLPMILVYTGIIWSIKLALQYALMYVLPWLIPASVNPRLVFWTGFLLFDAVLYLFAFALVSNIYTKRVHDQYSLYQ